MAEHVAILNDDKEVADFPLELGEVRLTQGRPGESEAVRFWLANGGRSALREPSLSIDSPYPGTFQLAVDKEGEPGVWAAEGQPIRLLDRALMPGEAVAFWARAVYRPEDVEGFYRAEFVFTATAVR